MCGSGSNLDVPELHFPTATQRLFIYIRIIPGSREIRNGGDPKLRAFESHRESETEKNGAINRPALVWGHESKYRKPRKIARMP